MVLLCNASRRTAFSLFQRSFQRPACRYASRVRIPTPTPFPVVDNCPSPTCTCREMPPGMDIDFELPLNGTMATYAEQVLVSTGQNDWKSKIEDEESGVFVRQLRKYLLRGGKYSDPYNNIMITNSSFPPTTTPTNPSDLRNNHAATIPLAKPGTDPDIVPQSTPNAPPASAFLLPSFQYVPSIPLDDSSIETFLKAFILPSQLHAAHNTTNNNSDNTSDDSDPLSRAEKNILLRQPSLQKQFLGARDINEILILICGHGGRDSRCGTLGPILQSEFEDKLQRQNISVLKDAPIMEAEEINMDEMGQGYIPPARVGLISHIGGHKFAGNVIVYIPPAFKGNGLAGKGIWYGRVEPGHVEGLVAETVLGGRVIRELFRGGIGKGGEIMRL